MRYLRGRRFVLGILILMAAVLAPPVGTGTAAEDKPRDATPAEEFSYKLLKSLETQKDDLDLVTAAALIAQAAETSILPKFWDDAPAWAKRTEFQWELNEDNKPEFSVLTLQPIYQTENLAETFFTQARLDFHRQFGQDRYTSNLGFGYRRLYFDNTLLGGVNVFYDREWRQGHNRLGVGTEVKWNTVDFAANYYYGLSDKRTVASGVTEQPLDGYNIELTNQVPYLPWARARVSYFDFHREDATKDYDGFIASLEMDLLSNLQVEMGYTDDDVGHNLAFVRFNFRLSDDLSTGPKGAYLFGGNAVDDKPFRMRDMSVHTLDKIRRVNDIVVERTSTGVTISRLN